MSISKQIKESDAPILRVNGAYEIQHQAWSRVYDIGSKTGGSTDVVFDCNNGSVQKVAIEGTINKLYVKNAYEGACYVLVVAGTSTPAFTAFDTTGDASAKLAAIKSEGGFASFGLTDASTDIISIIGAGGNVVFVSQAKDFKA